MLSLIVSAYWLCVCVRACVWSADEPDDGSTCHCHHDRWPCLVCLCLCVCPVPAPTQAPTEPPTTEPPPTIPPAKEGEQEAWHIHTHTHAHTHARTHACARTHTHTHTHTHIHTHSYYSCSVLGNLCSAEVSGNSVTIKGHQSLCKFCLIFKKSCRWTCKPLHWRQLS